MFSDDSVLSESYPESFEIVEGDFVPEEMEKRILKHTAVPVTECTSLVK